MREFLTVEHRSTHAGNVAETETPRQESFGHRLRQSAGQDSRASFHSTSEGRWGRFTIDGGLCKVRRKPGGQTGHRMFWKVGGVKVQSRPSSCRAICSVVVAAHSILSRGLPNQSTLFWRISHAMVT